MYSKLLPRTEASARTKTNEKQCNNEINQSDGKTVGKVARFGTVPEKQKVKE